jgi:2,3-dihydroxy-p-cumate/2,3-dihydroxybenzoate 3,4-dioxygenase
MVRYSRLGYVALNVSDLDRACAWYEVILGVERNARAGDGSVQFQTGSNRRGLMLYGAAKAGLKRIGWEVESDEQLGVLERQLEKHRITWRSLREDECAVLNVSRGMRIREPVTGAVLDFYVDRRPDADSGRVAAGVVKMRHLGHVVLGTPRYREAVAFYREVLNFKTSDEIEGRINLMRCFPNPYHHSFGIANCVRNLLHHVNFMVSDEDDLASARLRFARNNVPIVWQGTHPPSGNTFLFFLDPEGLSMEYGYGMELFPEYAAREARVFPAKAESFDSTGAHRDDRTASIGEIEMVATL